MQQHLECYHDNLKDSNRNTIDDHIKAGNWLYKNYIMVYTFEEMSQSAQSLYLKEG